VFSFHQVILNLAADAARVVVGVGSVMLLVVLLTRLWWRRRLARAAEPPPNVCRCGYPLGQLAVPRRGEPLGKNVRHMSPVHLAQRPPERIP
jgi:hypothetical protein